MHFRTDITNIEKQLNLKIADCLLQFISMSPFLLFLSANFWIMSSKLRFLANLDWMHSTPKSESLCWPMVDLKQFLTRARTLKDRSACVTVTGRVQNMRKATHTLGNKFDMFKAVILFSKLIGDSGFKV